MTNGLNGLNGLFDERMAPTYDADVASMFRPEVLAPTVDVLYELAHAGAALEFAIGTGRVALPLRERGVDVHGIELSQPMVDEMRLKPNGKTIPVTIGDMATTRVTTGGGLGSFQLVFLVFNTITNLLTQDEQVACFCNAAAHLEVGGKFVIEVFIPNLRKLPVGEKFVPFDMTPTHLGIDTYDVANQMLTSNHYILSTDDRVRTVQTPHRYAWPAEYDLMGRIAGMRLCERWSNWQREPFTSESTSHVSVWEKVEP